MPDSIPYESLTFRSCPEPVAAGASSILRLFPARTVSVSMNPVVSLTGSSLASTSAARRLFRALRVSGLTALGPVLPMIPSATRSSAKYDGCVRCCRDARKNCYKPRGRYLNVILTIGSSPMILTTELFVGTESTSSPSLV